MAGRRTGGVIVLGTLGSVALAFASLVISYVSLFAAMAQDGCFAGDDRFICTGTGVLFVMGAMAVTAGVGLVLGLFLQWRRAAAPLQTVLVPWGIIAMQYGSLVAIDRITGAPLL